MRTSPWIPESLLAQTPGQTPPQGDSIIPDSVGLALERIGETVTETGQQLIEGQWGEVGQRLVAYGTELLSTFIPKVISAVVVGVFFVLVLRGVLRVVRRVLGKSSRVNASLETLLVRTTRVAGIAFVLVLILSQLGVNVAALVAGLGIAGIALGFAAKDTLENFISGVTILLDRPFEIGDWVDVDGQYGEVVELTLRSTRIRTLGNRTVVVPNLQMINHNITNFSVRGNTMGLRVDIPFGIAYKERPAEARKAVLPLVEGDDRIASEPEPEVVVTKLNDSSVDMALRMFVKDPGSEYPIRFHYTERIREALRDANIEIPFPHLQLFIDEAKAFESGGGLPLRLVQEQGE